MTEWAKHYEYPPWSLSDDGFIPDCQHQTFGLFHMSNFFHISLLHILLSKVNQYVSSSRLSILGDGLAPIGIDFVLGSIGRIVSVWEANIHGQWRVTHEFGSTGHDRIAVGIGMDVGKELVLGLLKTKHTQRFAEK
jgi:hypothetical protein